ncbi:MAG: exodeoxyribonuclease V subunit gamma, partial [Persicimonas sp.]
MALQVYYSCDFDCLAEELLRRTETGRRGVAKWRKPVTVIVPSLTMGAYLELAVARMSGVAVNYRFTTLQGFLTEHIEEAARRDLPENKPRATEQEFRVLGRENLKTILLHHLGDPAFFDTGEFTAIERYISRAPRPDGKTADTRRYQLARQLATTFEEYIFSRADMLEKWRDGEKTLDDVGESVQETEAWQSALWRYLTDDDGAVRFDGQTYVPLPEAFERVRDELIDNLIEEGVDKLHVFGFAGFGEEFLKMLQKLGGSDVDDGLEVSIYFNNSTSDATELSDDAPDLHPALEDWGKVGRETLAQLRNTAGRIEQSDETRWASSSSTLGTLQEQIAAGKESKESVDIDASIRLLECPGLRREVEIIANEIWTLMGKNDDLRFSDIAIAVPDGEKDRYLAHIESVFSEFHELPYTINSLSRDSKSPVFEAVQNLIRLPFGQYRRTELLAFAVHPNVISRLRDADEDMWLDWADRLNILYGADRAHQSARGTYLSGDMFNWEQGLRRLALGSFLDVPSDGHKPSVDQALVEMDGYEYLPQQVDLSDVDAASAFTTVISSLTHDARWLANEKATLAKWSEILSALVETYIVPNTDEEGDYEADAKDCARVVDALEELAELPDVGEVSYRTASLYALDILSGLDTGGKQRFVGGVVISSPSKLRALPFDHVFVMGMGEGIFPSVDPHSELDLRLAERRTGDILPSERDKYHFLEILKATRSSLCLSWVGRESTTGESVPASSVVNDLRRMLGVRRPEKETESDALTTVFPLRRYDRHADQFKDFGLERDSRPGNAGVSSEIGPNYHPEAFREAQLDAVREQIEEEGEVATKVWTSAAFADANRRFYAAQKSARATIAPKEARRRPTDIVRINRPPTHSEDEAPTSMTRLRYSKLYQFLKTPLQTKAKVFGGIYDDKEDTFMASCEPFGYDNLQQVLLTRDVFANVLTDGVQEPDMAAELDAVARREYAPGDLPADVFQTCANRRLASKLDEIYGNLDGKFATYCGIDLSERAQIWELTPDAGQDQLEAPTIALDLDGRGEPTDVKLVGTSLPYYSETKILVQVSKSGSAKERHFLRGFIEHLVMSASDSLDEWVSRKVVVMPAKTWSRKASFPKYERILPALSRRQAREQLTELVSALLAEPSFHLLPIEVAEELVEEADSLATLAAAHLRACELARENDTD